jgi:hypothetical protein
MCHLCILRTQTGIATTGGNNPSGSSRNISEVTSSSYQQENTYITATPERDSDALRGDALRDDGTLKDASKMEWLHSPSDGYNRSLVQDEDTLEWPKSPSTSYAFEEMKRMSLRKFIGFLGNHG